MENNVFIKYYNEVKNKLNKKIEEYNNELKKENNSLIKENIDLFTNLNSDGKMVRGTLVNLGYKLKNEDTEYSYPLSLAFEIFQTAILVHDDIIDNDNLRRGKQTIHSYNYDKYYELTNDSNSKKIADSIAICMGDLGLYEANQVISKNYKDDSNLGDVLIYFNDIVLKTIKGEIIDVTLPFLEKNNLLKDNLEENIMLIYKLKTAYYTIIGPMSLGLILAGTKKEELEEIEQIGLKIGIAFQIQDDMLGIYSNDSTLGKKVGSDIEEFKQTLLYSYTKNNRKYYDELLKIYGTKVTEKDVEKVKQIFMESGAYNYALDVINKLYNEALEQIENIDWINKENKEILKGFVMYLNGRKK